MGFDPQILQLQKDLIMLGYNPGVPDGIWGSNTRGALHEASLDLTGTDFTGTVPQSLKDVVHEGAAQKRALRVGPALPPNYFDLSERSSSGWKKKDRAWSVITGVTLHQTGCPYPSNPERWLGLRAHYGVTYEGYIYRVRKETDFGWHAQGQSHNNVGIEIAGFFCGIEGDLGTRPGGPKEWAVQSVTDAQIAAVKELIRYLARLMEYNGTRLSYLHAHRQATDDRTPDPGSKVWQTIALPMIAELGLSDGGMGYVTGKGQPIPEAWNPAYKGIKY